MLHICSKFLKPDSFDLLGGVPIKHQQRIKHQLNINKELKEAVPSVATEQQKIHQHQPNQYLIRPFYYLSEKAGLKTLHGLNEINGLHWVKIC